MVRRDPTQRLRIGQVLAHPFFWTDTERVEKIRGWKTSWKRGRDLDRRLVAHSSAVKDIVGADGWLAKLDGAVAQKLQVWAGGRPYDGRNVLDLVRAVRNVFEHWFDRGPQHAEAERLSAVAALTSWGDGEMRGHQSADGQEMRAAAVARYFVRDRFPGLLLVFEFTREC
jgi:hypothetical protein